MNLVQECCHFSLRRFSQWPIRLLTRGHVPAAPGNTYNDFIVTVDSVPLKPVKEFCILSITF